MVSPCAHDEKFRRAAVEIVNVAIVSIAIILVAQQVVLPSRSI